MSVVMRITSFFAALALTACAGMSTSSPEDPVAARANARWKSLVALDFDAAYTYAAPGYRALVPLQTYRSRTASAVQWRAAEVSKVECPEESRCIVNIKLSFTPPLIKPRDTVVNSYFDETWIKEDGQWWIFLDVNKS